MKLRDFKKLNENWSEWASQGYPTGPRADLYDAIRDHSLEKTGSRETYGDFDKLDAMNDEELENYATELMPQLPGDEGPYDAEAEASAMRESAGGKLLYSVSNTGYGDVYEFFDENGEETEQTLGMMVLDLADAGVGGWAPEEQIDRMMAVNADPNKNQGGMQKWDSSVFEDYYGADNQKILQAWAKMSKMELELVQDGEDEYEDDGTNDFEEYYSESKKRNKIHEGRYHFANAFDELDISEDPRAQAFEQCIKILNELTYDSLEGDVASYADDAARLLWKAAEELDYKRNQVGNVEESVVGDMKSKFQDMLTLGKKSKSKGKEFTGKKGKKTVTPEQIKKWWGSLPASEKLRISSKMELPRKIKDWGDQEWTNAASYLLDNPVEEALSPEDERASEQAYAMAFEKGRKGMAVVDVCNGLTGIGHKACLAGHQDGANEFRQSLAERVRQTVVRRLAESKGVKKK